MSGAGGNGVGDNTIAAWAADLLALEADIDDLQTAKRDLYTKIRDDHGKPTAASLKQAVKLSRMDGEKRDAAEAIDAEAQRMLAIIEKGSRAPRATRTREIIEEFGADDLTDEGIQQVRDKAAAALAGVELVDLATGEILNSAEPPVAADQASEAEPRAEVSLATPLQEGSEPIEAHNLDRAGSTPAPATSHPTLGVGGSGESPGEATEEAARAPASSVVPITRDIRPWCLHKNDLSKCGGYGRQHCHSCLKAHADESGEAA